MGMYNLMGVKTPKIKNATYGDWKNYQASRKEEGFESLSYKGTFFFFLNDHSFMHKIKNRKSPKSKHKNWEVKGISDLLVASAWLDDWDVVGIFEPNIGLIADEKNKCYHIYKFDGEFAVVSKKVENNVTTLEKIKLFFSGGIPYSGRLNKSLDYKLQTNYNNILWKGYFTNLQSQVSLEERKESLKKLFAIKKSDIEAIANNVPDEVLPQKEKKEIVDYLDARIQKMHELYGDQVYRGSYNERIQGRQTGTWLGVGFGALFAVATGLYLGLKKILEPVYTTLVSIGIAAITPIIGTIAGSLFYDWPSFIGNKIFTKVEIREELQKKYNFDCDYKNHKDFNDDFKNYQKNSNDQGLGRNYTCLYTRKNSNNNLITA
jgi:hypothetical protein